MEHLVKHYPFSEAQQEKLIQTLYLIRDVEEEIAARYPEGKMRCPTHLSIGQEGTPAALSLLLSHQDLAVSTHRSHAHYLAKGGNLKAMLAEIYGKQGGCSGGKGGSMHLIDEAVGFKGSTAIVGNTIPIGVGLGLALKLQGNRELAVVYLGDGAIEEGVFYESANFAAVQKLPVLFVCENNGYSVYSSTQPRQPAQRKIFELARAIGLKSCLSDGNDMHKAFQHLQQAISDIRQGGGPWLVELETYRWREHCGPHYDNHIGYRSEQEFLHWQQKDPLVQFETYLLEQDAWSEQKLEQIRKNTRVKILQAFDYAESQPYPEPAYAYEHLYKVEG